MNLPNNQEYESLKKLIDVSDTHNEKECREYISYALDLFVPFTGITTILDDEDEYPGHTGPNDLIVFCETKSGGVVEKRAYIWEVKSAQSNVFVKCTENRVKPSPEFVKAENQLLHYWEDCKNEQFRAKFDISNLDCICLGGILIGKTNTLVSGKLEDSKKKRLYTTAINLRKNCFYSPNGIQFLIWDDVLDFIKKPSNISSEKQGDIGAITITGSDQPDVAINNPDT